MQKTWMWLRKGKLQRETESLWIATQINVVRTNHIKSRIDTTQENSKCCLCGDRGETINHIISECSKLAQTKYKTRHDWVSKVIPRELCKKFKFDHTNKWYMHNPSFSSRMTSTNSSGNLTYKSNLRQTRPYINKKKEENLQNCRFCSSLLP